MFCVVIVFLLFPGSSKKRIDRRIARIRGVKGEKAPSALDLISLRRKKDSVGLIGKIFGKLPSKTAIQGRIERAGFKLNAEKYIFVCLGGVALITGFLVLSGKSFAVSFMAAIIIAIGLPHFYLGFVGNRRVKKFLLLFPDAIDLIVRGLRSGLPVTESINVVGQEVVEPVGSIFANIGDSVKFGISLEKAMQDAAVKLKLTEFNFFVTSIILQRETGGNLSEILDNLSDVLRKRTMMRMKIKALSSEAKATAVILGSLPFLVTSALVYMSPVYMAPLFDTLKGNLIIAGALTSIAIGISVMAKMSKFEI